MAAPVDPQAFRAAQIATIAAALVDDALDVRSYLEAGVVRQLQ